MPTSREIAVHVLVEVLRNGRSLDPSLETATRALSDRRERAFAKNLCFGVLRWYWRLDAFIDALLEKPLRRKEHEVRVIILLGLYQLLDSRVPPHAAVEQTVSLARARGKDWACGLVNGVLRRFLREREPLSKKVQADEVAKFAHPKWLLDVLKAQWRRDWRNIVEANNQKPPMALRVNLRQTERRLYLDALGKRGLRACPLPYTNSGIMLTRPVDVNELPGFHDGWVSVQDAAAQLAAPLLVLKPGQRILDACAAPGGKAGHILEHEPDIRELVAIDKNQARLDKTRETLDRLGFDRTPATLTCADAAHPDTWWDSKLFDRILIDAPCSATGVIRRHPDVKVLRRADDVCKHVAEQRRLVDALWPLLAPKGLLLYATCSVIDRENQDQIERTLQTQTDASLQPITAPWGRQLPIGRQVLPGQDAMDGLYYAVLRKH